MHYLEWTRFSAIHEKFGSFVHGAVLSVKYSFLSSNFMTNVGICTCAFRSRYVTLCLADSRNYDRTLHSLKINISQAWFGVPWVTIQNRGLSIALHTSKCIESCCRKKQTVIVLQCINAVSPIQITWRLLSFFFKYSWRN